MRVQLGFAFQEFSAPAMSALNFLSSRDESLALFLMFEPAHVMPSRLIELTLCAGQDIALLQSDATVGMKQLSVLWISIRLRSRRRKYPSNPGSKRIWQLVPLLNRLSCESQFTQPFPTAARYVLGGRFESVRRFSESLSPQLGYSFHGKLPKLRGRRKRLVLHGPYSSELILPPKIRTPRLSVGKESGR